MAIEVVPTKVSDMGILQLVKECTERDPDRWQDEGYDVAVTFDGYYRTLPWDDFSTCSEPAFRNHIYAGVCSSVEEIARKGEAEFRICHLLNNGNKERYESFGIDFYPKGNARFFQADGENRAEAALRAFVSFLRATA